jgi:hypothetical protein
VVWEDIRELIVRLVAGLILAGVLVLLWLMPGALFPHPATNEAIALATAGPSCTS